ncbi:MAG TPA: biliverdin-producing heme oxygenase [Herpetosiphonaceae bacterium]|nr:biliverdin-producing heme oxygenase [Herpetosiphonaceae bacterium]
MILQEIKDATRAEHQALEATVDILGRLGSLEDYRALLARFWGFYAPLEPLLHGRPEWGERAMDVAGRRKVPLIERDLRDLGATPASLAALPRCADLPAAASFARALGCMYVLEGATLGGQLISREVRGRLALTPERGCGFFASYGDQVGPMWRAFQGWLLRSATDAESAREMMAGARDTFGAFGAWLRRGEGEH